MDIANQNGGMVVGTGDLSELALGWATYNGDHMSMYGVNASVPKTLVRYIIEYEMGRCSAGAAAVLKDILDTPIFARAAARGQWEHHAENGGHRRPVRGCTISSCTICCAAAHPRRGYSVWHAMRIRRGIRQGCDTALAANFPAQVFAQQFKRSCLPDGPKVGTVTLSPRGDWRMPSDASARLWLEEAERLE